MKIAHLILTRRFAGSERYAVELANAQSRDHEVTMILRRSATEARADAISQRLHPAVNVVTVGDWFSARQARALLRRLRPQIAHAHLAMACRALAPMRGELARVATLHIHYKPRQHARLDGLIAIAPWQLRDIPASLRAHSVQINNWTLPNPPAHDARARLRREHGMDEQALVFGALGRVERSKGFDVLIAAFEQAAIPGARLVIIGQGRDHARLQRSADSRVLMPGFTAQPQDWLACFDVFVSPSRSEPFGLVMLEAMQARLPILASATEGARHLAGSIGRPLLPVGDVAALAAAMQACATEGRKPVDYALDGYRIEQAAAQVEAFYQSTLQRLSDQGQSLQPR